MAKEIERKFLVRSDAWQAGVKESHAIRQGYLARGPKASIRIRVVDDASAMLTVKSAQAGRERYEFEYLIPVGDAPMLMQLCDGRVLEKRRHIVPVGGCKWEVDVFSGDLAGLVIAELELSRADAEITYPDWLGPEVTEDARYYNASLAANGLPE
ncbi:MAG TPA: CYTH domain-containing protein [Arsenicitalea sp.]|jgi:adenylate cyclase|nr:CYTH domain-containing protein [Arsenicitalea sp.]